MTELRNADGYRVGETHHRARVPAWAVRYMRDRRDEGKAYAWIQAELAARGVDVSARYVKRVCLYERRPWG